MTQESEKVVLLHVQLNGQLARAISIRGGGNEIKGSCVETVLKESQRERRIRCVDVISDG